MNDPDAIWTAEEACDRIMAHVDSGHGDAMAVQVVVREIVRQHHVHAANVLRELANALSEDVSHAVGYYLRGEEEDAKADGT